MRTLLLGDIADVSSPLTLRGHFDECQHGNARLLTIRDLVSMNPFNPEKLPLVSAAKPASRTSITENDILMPARGQNYPARIVPITKEAIFPTGQIHVIRTYAISPLYLLWYLNRQATQDQIALKLTGSTIQSLKKSDLQRLEIKIPESSAQEMIGDLFQMNLQRAVARDELARLEAQEISIICESAIRG